MSGCELDIRNIPGAIETIAGFPRVDWWAVRHFMKQTYPKEKYRQLVEQAMQQWLELLKPYCGDNFRIKESAHFVMLGAKSDRAAKYLLDGSEKARTEITQYLGELASKPKWGKHAILLFEDVDRYYRYLCHFDTSEGEFIPSGGALVSHGYWHIVIAPQPDIIPSLCHEFIHLSLGKSVLPRWLNEGLVAATEEAISSGARVRAALPEVDAAKRWTSEDFNNFWSGAGFLASASAARCYVLAWRLVTRIRFEQGFEEFVRHAAPADGGRSAAREQLHIDLEKLAEKLLHCADGTEQT